jgi:hypothetical protein
MRRRAGRGGRSAALSVLLVASLGACVGSVSHTSFDDEVHARGGGLSQQQVLDGITAIEHRLGVHRLELRSINVQPATVDYEVEVPGSIEDLDAYVYGTSGGYGGRGLRGPSPVPRSSSEPSLEAQVFTADQAGVAGLDDIVDAARHEADLPGGYAVSATLMRREGASGPLTSVQVTNVRRTVTVTFSAAGKVLGVQR